jgi:TP901 family phage tail tape measure protein
MSEQIEVEVGANLSKFNAGMTNVRNSVQRVAGGISRMDFSQSAKSMNRLAGESKKSGREANTLRGLFQQIGNTKIDSTTLKVFAEIFKELARIVKEFGPILTLAMNAGDGAIRKFINSNVKLLTQVERLSSNFLVLRKVLPVRLFRTMTVSSQRVSTSIVGMSNDIVNFAKFGRNSLRSVISSFGKVIQGSKSTASAIKGMGTEITSGQMAKAPQIFKLLGDQTTAMGGKVMRTIRDFRTADGIMGKLGVTMRGLGAQATLLGKTTTGLGGAFGNAVANSKRLGSAMRSLSSMIKGLNPANIAVKGSSLALGASFTALIGTSKVLVRTLGRVGGMSSRIGFNALSQGASKALAPIRSIGTGIKSIATRPIQSAGKALGGLAKMGSVAGIAITAVVGVFRTFAGLLSSSATGGVASFNKNFRKAMAELPNSAQGSFGKVRKEIMALQNEMGFTSDQALPALQQAFRKGFDADNAVGAVKQAMLLAKTGATDLEGAMDLLGNSMRAFASEGITASEASDALFRATRGVDVNVGSLSDSIKRLGPDLSSTGIGFNDFLGALKTLTQQGKLGATAIGEIKSLTASIVSPSEQAREAMGKLGVNFTKADLAGRGLGAILQEVRNATGGNAQAMAELLGGQENLNTALMLGAKNGTMLAGNLDEIANSAGGVAGQADKMDTAFSRTMKKLSARTETLKIQLGDLLKPLIGRLGEFLSEWVATFSTAIKVAIQLFQSGQLGEVLFLGISIGLRKGLVAVLNFGQGVTRALANSFVYGVQVLPKVVGQIIPNVLARLGKIGFFFIELGAQFMKAFETPIAYLTAGLKKAVEEAADAINKLPFVGDDKASKARSFEVILKQELQNSGSLAKNIQGFADQGYKNAEAIIKRTDGEVSQFIDGQVNALKKGFKEGSNAFELPPSVARDSQRLASILNGALTEVNEAGKATTKMAKDATLEANGVPRKAVGSEGQNGLGSDSGGVIASSLASIGGGGGVFGTLTSETKNLVNIAKQTLEEAKMQTIALQLAENGKVMR